MKETKTDRNQSLESKEFVWDVEGATEVHGFVIPVLKNWLESERPGSILDLGCGNGALTAALRPLCKNMCGTDSSETGIDLAGRNFGDVEFFRSSVDEPLPSEHHGRYDVVTAIEVIEHLLLPRNLFLRAKEALRPNGVFIVSTPYHGYWKNLALAACGKFDSHWHPLRDYGHVKFFSDTTLATLFEEQGFCIESRQRVGRVPVLARSMLMKGRLCRP